MCNMSGFLVDVDGVLLSISFPAVSIGADSACGVRSVLLMIGMIGGVGSGVSSNVLVVCLLGSLSAGGFVVFFTAVFGSGVIRGADGSAGKIA